MSRIDWMKEERKIYDERTLYLKVYSSFLATIGKERCSNSGYNRRYSGRMSRRNRKGKSTRYRTWKENEDYQFD